MNNIPTTGELFATNQGDACRPISGGCIVLGNTKEETQMRQLALLLVVAVTLTSCQAAPVTTTPASTKWEYKEVTLKMEFLDVTSIQYENFKDRNDSQKDNTDTYTDRLDYLNHLGKQGWEVIQVLIEEPYGTTANLRYMTGLPFVEINYLLKRPVLAN